MPPKIISRGRGGKLKASAVADSLALEQSEAEQLKRTRQNPPGSHEDSSRTSLNDGDPLVQIPLEQMALFKSLLLLKTIIKILQQARSPKDFL